MRSTRLAAAILAGVLAPACGGTRSGGPVTRAVDALDAAADGAWADGRLPPDAWPDGAGPGDGGSTDGVAGDGRAGDGWPEGDLPGDIWIPDQPWPEMEFCVPQCDGKDCGTDGCGGVCGNCVQGETCDADSWRCLSAPESMILVPAGRFWMGCNEAVDGDCGSDEYPYHEVYLDAYYVDETEVTVDAYGKCVEAGGCTAPWTWSSYCNWNVAGKEQHPVNCVEWCQTKEYCEWAEKRLCTEAEWEKAARGNKGCKYPWGNVGASCDYAVPGVKYSLAS